MELTEKEGKTMKKEQKKVYVAIMGERWDSDRVRIEFETLEEMVSYIKAMIPVVHCYEAYSEWVKR